MKITYILYLFFLVFTLLNFSSCKQKDSHQTIQKTTLANADLQHKFDELNRLIAIDALDSVKMILGDFQLQAQRKGDAFYIGKGHSFRGYLHLIAHENDSAFYHYNLANEYYETIQDSVSLAKSLTNMAIIQANLGDFSGSELTAIEALSFLKNQKDQSSLSSIYNCLAISTFSLRNYTESIYWCQKALQTTTDDYSKMLYRNNLAVAQIHHQNYNDAISILNVLKNEKDIDDYPILKAKVLDNLAYVKWKNNENYLAENDLIEALKIRETSKDDWGKIASHAHLSDYYHEKDRQKSLQHAHEMYRYATQLNSPDDRLEAYEKLIANEEVDQVRQYAERYTLLNDSLVTSRNQVKEQFAKIRFDSEKNREENQNLRAETAEQDLEIERRKVYTIVLISLLLILGISSVAYFRFQKIRNERKLNEEIYETEAKMARKVHDELANNVYRLMSEVEHQHYFKSENDKQDVLSKLDDIYALSRDISRENSSIITDEKYPNELLSLVSSYKNEHVNIMLMGFDEVDWNNFSKDVKIQFYKVLQELLTNMKKHSQASLVVLKFNLEEKYFNLFYTDNGIGLTDNQMDAKNGVQITETRIEKINGTINFASEINRGLKVNIKIPL